MLKEVTLESFYEFRNGLLAVTILSIVTSIYLLIKISKGQIKEEWIKYTTKAVGWLSIIFSCWLYTTYLLDYMFIVLFLMFLAILGFIYNLSMAIYIRSNRIVTLE